ncbi:MAG TPA: Rrf2 family transcriptional regulator [Ktedonobacterales bacterium]|jgi:Rrf2 family protein|nr:Rrf2 family transcriptional regulator [Ktedonobacterales bacterium]
MLRVSTRGEYGVRLMVHLARHYGDRPCSLTEISLAEGLELQQQYLEQLVRSLRQHGMVESTRGAHGGYRLAKSPEELRMSEILRALEGPIAPMICATEGEMDVICDRLDGCSTHFLWARVRDAVSATLDAITLADLLREADSARAVQEVMASQRAVQRLITLTPRAGRSTPGGAGAQQQA